MLSSVLRLQDLVLSLLSEGDLCRMAFCLGKPLVWVGCDVASVSRTF